MTTLRLWVQCRAQHAHRWSGGVILWKHDVSASPARIVAALKGLSHRTCRLLINSSLQGMNTSVGGTCKRIDLRLRPFHDPETFYPFEVVLGYDCTGTDWSPDIATLTC